MDSLEKNDNALFQNSTSFLHNISSLDLCPPALKTKARLMELRTNVQVPSNTTRTTVRCQRCFLNLIDGPAKYTVKPEEKKSKFARIMLAKMNQGKPMTKYQRKYIKRLNPFSGNQLIITCKFCDKESLVKMEKPKKLIRRVMGTVLRKRKKTKRKDKFCGLNQEVVLSVTPKKSKKIEIPEFIPLESSEKKPAKFKLRKKEDLSNNDKEVITKVDIRKNNNKLKNKNKLKKFLNSSNSTKITNSPNLKHFLQSL